MKSAIVAMMNDILMTHLGETLSAEFVSCLSNFLDDQATELGETSLELKQVSADLEIIAREFPLIWNDAMLGTLAAQELSSIRKSGRFVKHSPLDQYRIACHRVMTAWCTRPDGTALH